MKDSLLLIIIAMPCFIKADLASTDAVSSLWYISGSAIVLMTLLMRLSSDKGS